MAKSNTFEIDTIGSVIRGAREAMQYNRKQLATLAGISERYLTAIENEGRKPSLKVLCRLIRLTGVSADSIFYPERRIDDSEVAKLVHIFTQCNDHDRQVAIEIIRTLFVKSREEA